MLNFSNFLASVSENRWIVLQVEINYFILIFFLITVATKRLYLSKKRMTFA